ncbi:type II toxin-antitoxin system Phd/YefM family antitoxin [Escherichia albertii]|nr:type II toxin-antitoxin system Phd/YefM family antitoxin [Escherichia albertii]
MQTYTSTQARANIATVLDTALNGEPVEITRRDGSITVIATKVYICPDSGIYLTASSQRVG